MAKAELEQAAGAREEPQAALLPGAHPQPQAQPERLEPPPLELELELEPSLPVGSQFADLHPRQRVEEPIQPEP